MRWLAIIVIIVIIIIIIIIIIITSRCRCRRHIAGVPSRAVPGMAAPLPVRLL
jgi:hypothetical protein